MYSYETTFAVLKLSLKWYVMRRVSFLPLLVILVLVVTTFSCSSAKTESSKQKEAQRGEPCIVEKVIDGDTFECYSESIGSVKVRLIGIDTPESRYNKKLERDVQRSGKDAQEIIRMGRAAKEFIKSLLPKGSKVYLEFDVQRMDKYGRLLAYVWLESGKMLNQVLLEEGYAQVYTIPPNVKYEKEFLDAQRKARQEGKGLWGEF